MKTNDESEIAVETEMKKMGFTPQVDTTEKGKCTQFECQWTVKHRAGILPFVYVSLGIAITVCLLVIIFRSSACKPCLISPPTPPTSISSPRINDLAPEDGDDEIGFRVGTQGTAVTVISTGNFVRVDCEDSLFYINGRHVASHIRSRGLNIVALDRNLTVLQAMNFDTYVNPTAGAGLKNLVDSLPDDSLVLVAAHDSSDLHCGTECRSALRKLGGTGRTMQFRESYTLIGYKGEHSRPDWVREKRCQSLSPGRTSITVLSIVIKDFTTSAAQAGTK